MNFMLIALLSLSSAWASCPDFAGRFEWENPDPADTQKIELRVQQSSCTTISAEYDYGRGTVFPRYFQIDGTRRLIYEFEDFRLFETHEWKGDKIFVKAEYEHLIEENQWETEEFFSYLFFATPNLLVEKTFKYNENGSDEDVSKSYYLRK